MTNLFKRQSRLTQIVRHADVNYKRVHILKLLKLIHLPVLNITNYVTEGVSCDTTKNVTIGSGGHIGFSNNVKTT